MKRSLLTLGLSMALSVFAFGAASGQTPTEAERQALRANCAADYRANCSSIPPGGMASLVCLEQNVAKLSPACQGAVDAVKGGPKTPTAKPATDTASNGAQAEAGAPTVSATVPTSKPVAPTKPATPATPATAAAAGTAPATPAPVTAAPPPKPERAAGQLDRIPFRDEVRLAARDCLGDFRRLCPDLPIGHGNLLTCLQAERASLDPVCRRGLDTAGAALR